MTWNDPRRTTRCQCCQRETITAGSAGHVQHCGTVPLGPTGAAWMAGKAILPMLASGVKPKIPRAVEKVVFLQIFTMFGYMSPT